ncbi:KamA family radical SAM protein [Pseudoalteromonas sp. ASV78]|uniref:KamA family radical SAM protein n=1 Tax=Pseudoalteromonas sp. ASV78 TaxID=3397851 RepID=UPI0039FB8B80
MNINILETSDLDNISNDTQVGDCSNAAMSDYLNFRTGDFWRKLVPYENVTASEFNDHRWQVKNSISSQRRVIEFLKKVASEDFIEEVEKALNKVPMRVRITPYMLSLIDWDSPVNDPIRLQFLPLSSEICEDHPMLTLDSLNEQADSPIEHLVHRYPDKVLFLPQSSCPVYCRYCTRSYAVGGSTDTVEKKSGRLSAFDEEAIFAYLSEHTEIEDVVVSGGDLYNLTGTEMRHLGIRLLRLPNIKRIRLATKGLAISPMRILNHDDWTQALIEISAEGRRLHKQVALHTHFNHCQEITDITRQAMQVLYANHVTVRNQAVMLRGVNDSYKAQSELIKLLSALNIQPYYVYQHDMVQGLEFLRTPLWRMLEIEEKVRGITAGFNIPTFVVDLPNGGGKRDVWSFRYYDQETGLSVYRAPSVKENTYFFYADPLHSLSYENAVKWDEKGAVEKFKKQALDSAQRNSFKSR